MNLGDLCPKCRRYLMDSLDRCPVCDPKPTPDTAAAPQSITCPCCGATSYNPNDIGQGYCGRCHWWTSDPTLGPHHLEVGCDAKTN